MDFKRLGKQIREVRKEQGLTQEKLAELIGMSTNHISHIESGLTKLSIETLVSICNALNTTPDNLMWDSAHNTQENIKGEIGKLLKSASHDDLLLINKVIKAILDK